MSQNAETPPVQAPIPYQALDPQAQRQRLGELAQVFFKLGAIAFGGPAAHIAMMDDEIVKRRQWMSHESLLDLLGITNLIPGPNSTELAIHIGYARAGWRGLVVAGTCFILPAMTIVWVLAVIYVQFQTVPQVEWLLYGIKPTIIAIVVQALWKLGRKALKDRPTTLAGLAVVVLFFFKLNEILLLVLAGLAVMLAKNFWRDRPTAALLFPLTGVLAQTPAAATSATLPATWPQVFLFFLKIGSVLYGSGYVLLAFLQRDLVERMQWLTSQQLLDAIAIGQLTPGPVFTTATFVGYLLAGHWGAIAGTVGIFLPAFVLVLVIHPFAAKMRRSPWASGFLDGVNAASLGLMAVVTWQLGNTALVDWLTILVAAISVVLVFRTSINSAWLVIGGAVIGFVAKVWLVA